MKAKIITLLLMLLIPSVLPSATFVQHGAMLVSVIKDNGLERDLECHKGMFSGKTGITNKLDIPIAFGGRLTQGDLDNDGHPDITVANRNEIAAYDLCGKRLWRKPASTNWTYASHVFWNWTSYGWIGDADGDNEAEFLHIGANWRTLYIRNGATGSIEKTVDLGPETQWMYVLLGKRAEDSGVKTTKIYVVARPGTNMIKSFDIRPEKTPSYKQEWFYKSGRHNNAYMVPTVANINAFGGDEIAHSTVAVYPDGREIWKVSCAGLSVLSACHTLQVKDMDLSKPGLEATFSVYQPDKGLPSIISTSYNQRSRVNWATCSPQGCGVHPHQHVVGDFDPRVSGLEVFSRHGNGKNHFMMSGKGALLSNYSRPGAGFFPGGWNDGEIINGIHWDDKPGLELLSTERHVRFRQIPRLVITTALNPVRKLSNYNGNAFFHGGYDLSPTLGSHPKSPGWFGYVDRGNNLHDDDGPYEGNAHPVDLFGDGREEILTLNYKNGRYYITIYYNSGEAGVEPRRGKHPYDSSKKIWGNVYNPR